MAPTDVWVLLWSQSQCALHIETLDDMITSNAAAWAEDRRMDYVVLLIGDRELIDELAEKLHPDMDARSEARG